jgi:CRISPR/Cas system-associated protein endoribonuclease Cas2
MSQITVTFDELGEMSPTELKASIKVYAKARDQYIKDGWLTMADIQATVLDGLVQERDRRQKAWQETQRLLTTEPGDDEAAEWLVD